MAPQLILIESQWHPTSLPRFSATVLLEWFRVFRSARSRSGHTSKWRLRRGFAFNTIKQDAKNGKLRGCNWSDVTINSAHRPHDSAYVTEVDAGCGDHDPIDFAGVMCSRSRRSSGGRGSVSSEGVERVLSRLMIVHSNGMLLSPARTTMPWVSICIVAWSKWDPRVAGCVGRQPQEWVRGRMRGMRVAVIHETYATIQYW